MLPEVGAAEIVTVHPVTPELTNVGWWGLDVRAIDSGQSIQPIPKGLSEVGVVVVTAPQDVTAVAADVDVAGQRGNDEHVHR